MLVMVLISGGIAIYMYENANELNTKWQQIFEGFSLGRPSPVIKIQTPLPEPFETEIAPTVVEKKEKKAAKKDKKKIVSLQAPTQPIQPTVIQTPEMSTGQLVENMGKDLDSVLDVPDLSRLDQSLRKSNRAPLKQESLNRKLKKLKPEDLQIEVKFPSVAQFLKQNPSQEKITKSFDFKSYQSSLRSRLYVVEDCYIDHEDGLRPGKISLWINLAKTGKVKEGRILFSSYANSLLQKCIMSGVKTVTADPAPWENFAVTYTFNFQGVNKTRF